MQSDHAKPAAAFVVLVVLAAATVGSGLSHQDADGAGITAAAPPPGAHPHGERPTDRLTPFDPTRTVTLTPRPTAEPDPDPGTGAASGVGPAAGERSVAPERRDRRPSRSRIGHPGGGTDVGPGARAWSPGNGNGRADGRGVGPSGSSDTPMGHR
jgi:hypothetical protein